MPINTGKQSSTVGDGERALGSRCASANGGETVQDGNGKHGERNSAGK